MNRNDLKIPGFFTTNGEDIGELKSYCHEPTAELINLKTGKIESFGLNGITANREAKCAS